jgi:antitoxin PrlF
MPVNETLPMTANVTSNGQVVLPHGVREVLGVGSGGDVTIVCNGNHVVMMNPVFYELSIFQEAMKGEAERVGLHNEDDVMELVRGIRYELEGIPLPTAPQVPV